MIPAACSIIFYAIRVIKTLTPRTATSSPPHIVDDILNSIFNKSHIRSFYVDNALLLIQQSAKLFWQDITFKVEMGRRL